ncbi:CGG triplet repeat-binding protein 1 [Frankliniella fusca]|uniref:CGG triplet repeat-binding protein 1 n=1 Tax=Frankliniella fusca TaxID=407009 RepID=A0AAE1HYX8_9NEOP|nr:CGG triplet repeat-binding protein 1 [Frankliniella fusca]
MIEASGQTFMRPGKSGIGEAAEEPKAFRIIASLCSRPLFTFTTFYRKLYLNPPSFAPLEWIGCPQLPRLLEEGGREGRDGVTVAVRQSFVYSNQRELRGYSTRVGERLECGVSYGAKINKEDGGDFNEYAFDKKAKIMHCKFCNVRVDWSKKSSIDNHCKSTAHKKYKTDASMKRQSSISDAFEDAKKAKQDKEQFIKSVVSAF